jgi:pyruvate dehydrogenase E1 component alpha subunit
MENSQLFEAYKKMVLIRKFELAAKRLFEANKLPGFLHLYVGQEAVATGVCSALKARDQITSTHRGHGHLIAKGGDVKKMMAELFGKSTGYCKGRGGSMHISDYNTGILGANGIVGAGIPIATGAAFAFKYKGEDSVAVSFFGDGASNRGTFHEALNIASAFKLPVIFICENNLYAISVDSRHVNSVKDIADRAVGYSMPSVIVDGNDVNAVYEATVTAVARARAGEGPTLIECKTWRHLGHYVGDPDDYRTSEEKEAWLNRDPIPATEKQLVNSGFYTQEDLDEILNNADKLITEAIVEAENAPYPDTSTLLDYIYAD